MRHQSKHWRQSNRNQFIGTACVSTAIIWFRQDLRTEDNPALYAACKHHQTVIPLYIYDEDAQHRLGSAQTWWLHHSLQSLQDSLQTHQWNLCLRRGKALDIMSELLHTHSIEAVYWNRCYEPASIQRDEIIKSHLKSLGITCISFNGSLLNEPWTVKNKANQYFKVFTPFWKQALQQLVPVTVPPITQWPQGKSIASDTLDNWHLLPSKPNWAKQFADYWQPGEASANKVLNTFITNQLSTYKADRNVPILNATSHLSPHLHFGEISPWAIVRAVQDALMHTKPNQASAEHFLSELGWREFSYYLLYHFPTLPSVNFRAEFDAFPWQDNFDALKRWQTGQTGYPIVDAGMRELWHTGYMHNRVRMIVASFLIKDLLIDWRLGAAWFFDTLLDADLANNSASWQWVAGSGADAAPYFRIFNPVLQGEKFDPEGLYTRHWVPEIKPLSSQWIHQPWSAPAHEQALLRANHYPERIVDHNLARNQALAAYQAIRASSKNNQ